jgi:hypothetical protein
MFQLHFPSPQLLTMLISLMLQKSKRNPTVKVSLTNCMPNLVYELSELVFMRLYNEYHLQELGKENIATPAQDNGHPELKGPAERKKKSRVCIVPSMLWIIFTPLPFARCHEQSTARYLLSGNSGNAM